MAALPTVQPVLLVNWMVYFIFRLYILGKESAAFVCLASFVE